MKPFKFFLCALLALVMVSVMAVGCTKESTAVPMEMVELDKSLLTEAEYDLVWVDLEQTHLWRYETLKAMLCDSAASTWTVDERYAYLKEHMLEGLPDRNTETQMETTATKWQGNANINGGKYTWDASANTLAMVIASMGTVGDNRSPLNYHNNTNGQITWADASRAAQGYYNTSPATNNAIEITNIVWLSEMSGDGNWLIGADVTVGGVTTVYTDVNPLIYDPVPGGITIVGPMPGGFVEVVGNGSWPTPPIEEANI